MIRCSDGSKLFTLVDDSLLHYGLIPYLWLMKMISAGSATAIEMESKITWYKILSRSILLGEQVA
jgi:hypothetical protein